MAKTPQPTESPYGIPPNNPTSRPFYRDEPIETRSENEDFILDSTQFAWKASESVVPLKMKGQISYSESFQPPRLQLGSLKKMSVSEMLVVGALGFTISFALVIFVNLSLLLMLNILSPTWISLLFTIFSFFIFSFLTYIFNKRTVKNISYLHDEVPENNNSSILTFGLIYILHMAIASAISITFVKIFQGMAQGANQNIAIYLPFLLTAVILSIISPIFRIAKNLSSLRESSAFHSLVDAYQFPRFSLKKVVQSSLISFLLPASILIAGLNSFSKVFLAIFSPTAEFTASGLDYAISSIVFLIFTISVIFGSFLDINGIYFFEKMIKENVEPPSLTWVSDNFSQSQSGKKGRTNMETDSTYSNGEREERCPTCSALIIEGAEFCTDCGKKIVK